ncbi:hypothetical protein V6N12_031984 [Hibiscus sabdariffa]|uniref:Protein FAR1-RELATED SEQUENCE n=1 Tax=Hibiscus sabdariffa TaxID=183260 RepID=A0ABR2C063_9ROSI
MDKQISEQDKGSGEIESYTDFATSVHSNLSDEIIPRVGMEFNTEQDVYEFYNKYASTRIKDKRDDDVKYHRPETRFRSQRKINLAQVTELEIADRSGLAAKESVGFLARKVSGIENLDFIPENYSNYLRTKRTTEMKVGDTGGILEYLQNMQQDDPSFSYAIQEAKIGVAINSSMSTRSNDPKVDVGNRYKTLLRWYSHLAARASMSEQSFDIAMGDGEKTLSKVETTLKQLSIEESLNTCDGEKCQVDANNEKRVKGIKCKPRKKGDGSSIRLKSALEKATRKRNRRNDKSLKALRDEEVRIIDPSYF